MDLVEFSHFARCHSVAREAVKWPHVQVERGGHSERRNAATPNDRDDLIEGRRIVREEYEARVVAFRDHLVGSTPEKATVGQIRAVAFPVKS